MLSIVIGPSLILNSTLAPRARLAVVLQQAAQHRLAVGDVEVVRPVVADQHEALAEVDRVELGEAAADVQPVHDQHGDAGLQVGLAAHREAGRGQQRVAHDQVGHQLPQRAARLAS